MIIGIDIRGTQNLHQYRGIGHYIESLVTAIAAFPSDQTFVLCYSDKEKLPQFASSLNAQHNIVLQPLNGSKSKGIELMIVTDIFNPPANTQAKVVSIFYDAIPNIFKHEYFRSFFLRPDRILRYLRYRKSLARHKKSDAIITISESSKNDILALFPSIQSSKVKVVYPGLDTPISNKSTVGSNDADYLLYVGSCDYRKNVVDVVKAHAEYCERYKPIELRLVGRDLIENCPVELEEAIQQSPYTELINRKGYVADADIAQEYRNARAFLFCSLYEGFGLPVLQAMQHNCPVVTYRNSSLYEVGDDAVLYAKNSLEMANQVNALTSSVELRRKMISRGIKQAHKFTWQASAKGIIDVCESIET